MSFPYANSIPGFLSVIKQLRSVFPKSVTSDTLKKWGQAPNNETYVLATLVFLGILNEDGTKNESAASVFVVHDDEDFKKAFGALAKAAYTELFETFGEGSWTLEKNKLIGFFRQADKTSDVIGKRQASTFQAIAAVSGYGELPAEKSSPTARPATKPPASKKPASKPDLVESKPAARVPDQVPQDQGVPAPLKRDANLTVRIEINLPVTDDQTVYDKIFKSIRENLLNIE